MSDETTTAAQRGDRKVREGLVVGHRRTVRR